jgi:hypothetical protein
LLLSFAASICVFHAPRFPLLLLFSSGLLASTLSIA